MFISQVDTNILSFFNNQENTDATVDGDTSLFICQVHTHTLSP